MKMRFELVFGFNPSQDAVKQFQQSLLKFATKKFGNNLLGIAYPGEAAPEPKKEDRP